jgi:hypothetical protein
MTRKVTALPKQLIDSTNVSGTTYTESYQIPYQDNAGIQFIFTASAGIVANLGVQATISETEWTDLTLSSVPEITQSGSDSILVNINQAPYKAVRGVVTVTSGSFSALEVWAMSKTI